MNNLKKFVTNNSRFITILYIVLLIIVLLLLIDENAFGILLDIKEHFNNPVSESQDKKDKTIILHNILVTAQNYANSPFEPNNKRYFSSILFPSTINNNNFVTTTSLKSNRWERPNNNTGNLCNITENCCDMKKISKDNPNKKCNDYIVVDLTYDKKKHLIAIGMKIKNKKTIYDIFRKKDTDYKSEWEKIESNQKMRSLCYDLKSGRLLGINSFDGQIYEAKYSTIGYGDWIGPINYDVPMKKIMYDKDGIMIGIGLIDNFIYRKKHSDWNIAKWDKDNINKTKVYDLIYDTDGCFIATTPQGLMKQNGKDFNSLFVPYDKFEDKFADDLLEQNEILKYRTGIEFVDDMNFLNSDNSVFDISLKKLYDFKKLTKDLCSYKNNFKEDKILDKHTGINEINKNNEEITELYNKIDVLTSKLNI